MEQIQIDLTARVKERLREASMAVYGMQVKRRTEEGRTFVRDPDAEAVILQDWRFAYLYAREFIRDRWPAFEEAISVADPIRDQAEIRCVFNYVKYVRGSRMRAAEKHIANDAQSAVDYARDVLGHSWDASIEDSDAANATIAMHPTAASAYRAGM